MEKIVLLIGLLTLSAIFSAAETALTSLSHIRVSRMVEQQLAGAKLVQRLKKRPSDFLAIILIGNNLVTIAAAAIATSISIGFVEARGLGHVGLAVGIATGIMTLLILVFGEITPKTVALRNAERLSLWVAPIIIGLQILLRPVAYLIGFFCWPFIFIFGGKAPEKGPFITEEEIRLILTAGESEGVIEREEREMITSIFEFGETVAREVMTPRPDITAAEPNRTIDEIKNIILDSGHSRIPIYEGNLDNVIGLIYAKDLLKFEQEKGLRDFLRPVIIIPETKKVSELLHEMQAARTHLAVIVDEFGMTSGVVTLEDLIEEIVGEIHDEFEREERMVDKLDDGSFIVDGRLSLKDLNDRLQLNLPEKKYDTIGGFVFGQLGRAPSVGGTVKFENHKISVERVLRRRITRVKITRLPNIIGEEAVGG
ncbi:hypothetical protein A3H38_05135 [candidate division WOR-1 bacterium RIFCSPLOWO2_02_FULL_46_20]|uniref:Hemolysin n=2 Tax=Saganbacteria TaxID=1703751 RepID=A0A1F4R4D2_UNCSA|nr:MAG: hypothetical protein A3J44_04325 [candidate division WOR-1 bacterium RIFCSPHIGHO2_02_FULL_45_12]OGC03058.1 MAG: hypothetical protein A3H38_05135 [candidate division WOR-1 bacterium RIFCSPLOWO2_02_FULL_46_20]OGC09745.1 MAG: hypothetical protein A3F86_06025 [candidate division WOR-1 bacterium RIFCSPLOWO2_12_FULL_45_9]